MRVRDLGPLLVERADGERPCSGAKQAAILATLTMNVNRRVSNDDLIVAAWGYDASVSTSTLENHVWRLRQLLDPTHGRPANSSLLNESGGYRLVLPSDAVDSLVFEDLAKRSRALLADGDAAGALHSCEAALSLWRGDPYEVVGHTTAASAATAKITELREQVVERRVDALLAVGDLSGALADLQVLTTQHPFRERLWAQLMIALARSGRVEEALQTFQRVRSLMRGELGVEPGTELQRLHMQILAQETERDPSSGRERSSGPPASTGVRVPRPTSLLVGREYELAELQSWLTTKPLVTITGPGGSGKTRLAIEVALASAKRFPDGVWFVDLTTVTDSRLVVDAITSTLGLVVGDRAPLETIVDYVRARQLLLVVDNCEHVLEGVAETAEALWRNGGGSDLLTTSREPLDIDAEAIWELAPLPLQADAADPGRPPAASQLFLARMAGPPGPDDLSLIGQICEAVDGLPLAIELAAARTRWFSLAEIVQQVTEDPSRLTRIGRGPADHRTTLWNAIEWSHQLLTPAEQVIHRRLSVLPGPFTLPVATAVTQGTDLDVGDIPGGLARLAHRSLLMSSRATLGGRPSVFRQLDTVRAHARHHLSEVGETAVTLDRRDSWVRQLLAARPRLGDPNEVGWFDAIDDTYSIVRATFRTAVRADPDLRLLRWGSQLIYYWYYRRRVIEARHWLEDVLATIDTSTLGDAVEVTMARLALGGVSLLTGRVDAAVALIDDSLQSLDWIPGELLIEVGELLVTVADSGWAKNEFSIVARVSAALNEVAVMSGDPLLLLMADKVDCESGLPTRDLAVTAARAEELYEQGKSIGNLLVQWEACGIRQIVCVLGDDPATGIIWIDRLIATYLPLGDGGGGAFLEALANFAALTGDAETAIPLYAASQVDSRRSGTYWPIQLQSDTLLERMREQTAPEHFLQLWTDGQGLTFQDVARSRGLT